MSDQSLASVAVGQAAVADMVDMAKKKTRWSVEMLDRYACVVSAQANAEMYPFVVIVFTRREGAVHEVSGLGPSARCCEGDPRIPDNVTSQRDVNGI